MTLARTILSLTALSLAAQACVPGREAAPSGAGAPKVILIVGDGMDDQQITIARNYLVGSDGRLVLDGMPFRGAVQVQAVREDDPAMPSYVSDSANTATSIATGVVTSPGRIGTAAGTDADLTTIMELAGSAGFGTGIVTTSSLTDATPAAFVAHVNQRFCQGPRGMVQELESLGLSVDCSGDFKANGGAGSIAEQIAASDVDVLLGGGARYFDQPIEGSAETTVAAAAAANGYRLIRDRAALGAVARNGRVLGLFAPNTLPVMWRGAGGAKAVAIERLDGRPRLPEPFSCEPNPEFDGMPPLAQMTQTALDLLDPADGFVLLVESASIDKQSHLRQPCGHIGELGQLDDALRVALAYADRHAETLILVTADHSHAAQLVSDTGAFLARDYASPGYFARVRTPEGAIMGVNYATNDSPIQEYHTGSQVPILASGAGASGLPAFMAQSEIFGIMVRHLEL